MKACFLKYFPFYSDFFVKEIQLDVQVLFNQLYYRPYSVCKTLTVTFPLGGISVLDGDLIQFH